VGNWVNRTAGVLLSSNRVQSHHGTSTTGPDQAQAAGMRKVKKRRPGH
jgi:hypothetical protein